MVGLPIGLAAVETPFCVDFVHQDVAPIAGLDDGVRWDGVASDNDRTVGGIEAKAVGMFPGTVWHLEGGHSHILVPLDFPLFDLVCFDLDSGRVLWLATVKPVIDVL